jgi:hypothetical protein
MATLTIRGRIKVVTVRTNAQRLGYHMAQLPKFRAYLWSVANVVAYQARANVMAAGRPGGQVQYPVWRNRRWSAQPSAVARQITVKDATKVFRLGAPSVAKAGYTRVALVVSDHPYSMPYEVGGLGISSTAFMRAAVRKVAAANTALKVRRPKQSVGGGP